ncbi:50S ribosomal protein L11 methyltransferase [Neorhizobium sp. IRAMC:178]|uniref:class I SAM-dependent methyltransferase n=1 Tax=Neorhizobium tunisiense TaxID=3144793 RepID=UPI0031F6AD79
MHRFIRENFSLGPVATVPEISLYTAGPRSGLWRLAEHDDNFGAPYWAHLWGGGLALARYILDHPTSILGRRVLDLGAGSGIVGVAAAKAGASMVVAADIDSYAMSAIELNGEANQVEVSPMLGDLTSAALPEVDVVLAGDLFYEEELAAKITDCFDRCSRSGITVLVGDPGRAFLPKARFTFLATYAGPDFSMFKPSTEKTNSVFMFNGSALAY